MNKITSEDKTCEHCRYCYGRTDGAGFVTYYCEKKPGLVVGESSHLEGTYFSQMCDDYEGREL